MIHYITCEGIGQPWVGNELRIVGRAGVDFKLHAMREPREVHFSSEWARRIQESTIVLYPLPLVETLVSVVAGPLLFGWNYVTALFNALFGKRETLRGRIAGVAHFVVACFWARRLRKFSVGHIHAQWAHSPATIGLYASWLLGVPFSFTGHAADLFRNRVALRDKIHRARFIICISQFHRQFFKSHGARDDQLKIAYCGIDISQFKPQPRRRSNGVLRIRSSGRLVEKKGFRFLIDACNLLRKRGVAFECVIAGSGPLESGLRQQAVDLGLEKQVLVTGEAIRQEEIPDFMHEGDLYCLPCVWGSDNDVDGLPQMLMEAMACGLPVVSTRLVGIPDLVVEGKTGLLVEPENSAQLADAIHRLGDDSETVERLAEDGRQWVVENFNIETSLDPLIREFHRETVAAR